MRRLSCFSSSEYFGANVVKNHERVLKVAPNTKPSSSRDLRQPSLGTESGLECGQTGTRKGFVPPAGMNDRKQNERN